MSILEIYVVKWLSPCFEFKSGMCILFTNEFFHKSLGIIT